MGGGFYGIGEQARVWKGMDAGYSAKHKWIIEHYGSANHCENDPSHEGIVFDWANISGEYRRDRDDYKQLCRSCHRLMDKGNVCKHGHELTPANTLYKQKPGEKPYRQCRTCNRLWMRNKRAFVKKTAQPKSDLDTPS